MPLEIQNYKFSPNGVPHTFTFSDQVSQCLAGISSFNLTFAGSGDHHVKRSSISLTVSRNNKDVSVTANATLTNSDNAKIDNANSSITVTVIAWIDSQISNLILANTQGIPAGKQSDSMTMPKSTTIDLDAFLSGFNFTYASDHTVRRIYASVTGKSNNTLAYIDANGEMSNCNGDVADTTIDGALLANCEPSLNIELKRFQVNNNTSTLNFSTAVSKFEVLLSAFQVQYGGDNDHYLKSFGAEVTITNSNNTVTVSGGANMKNKDDSDNHQDDAVSFVSGFVIGY